LTTLSQQFCTLSTPQWPIFGALKVLRPHIVMMQEGSDRLAVLAGTAVACCAESKLEGGEVHSSREHGEGLKRFEGRAGEHHCFGVALTE
jgi:hypothetical protein